MASSRDAVRTLRLEVERPADPGELVNLVQNPDGRLGAWGYVTPVDGSVLRATGDATGLTYASPGGVTSHFETEPMPVTPGTWAVGRWVAPAGDGAYRTSIDWLAADRVTVVASTVPSAYYGYDAQARTIGAEQVPAGAAYAQLRWNHYVSASGGAATAGMTMQVAAVTFTVAATATDLGTVRTNLFPYPSAETGTTGGWKIADASLAPVSGGLVGGTALRATKTRSAGDMEVTTSYAVVTSGRDVALQVRCRAVDAARTLRLFAVWYDAAGDEIGTRLIDTATQPTPGTWSPVLGGSATAPSNARGARLRVRVVGAEKYERHDFDASMAEHGRTLGPYFDGDTTDAGGVVYAWTGTPHASTSTATSGEIGDLQPTQWLNILGPTHDITVRREALQLSTLEATVLDSELDPARAATLRPGLRARLMAVDAAGADQVLFTGWVGLDLSVEYRLLENDETRRARISLTAVDAVNRLASTPRAEGVATIADLPYVLEGAGVPWSVNGSGDQVPTATVAAYNDNATAADQLAVTRDTVHGYAWVDREGVVQAWDRNLMAAAPTLTLDESVYNSGFEAGYSTETIVNSVGVIVLKVIATSGVTEEVAFGPFRDDASVAEWGVHHQDYTVSIDATEAAASAWAAAILATNATPQVLLRQCVIPVQTVDHLERALLDLYDPVTVVNARAGLDQVERVTTIEHAITATTEGGKWLVTVGFAGEGVAPASPSVPSPPPRVGDVKTELDDKLALLDADLDELNTVTLPQLQTDLAQLNTDLGGIQGMFPITATSITDGAITTPKLAANAVTADKILANSISGDKIIANSIGADQIAANSIGANEIIANSVGANQLTANAVDGKTITGATLKTAASGARVQVSSASNPFKNGQQWGLVQFFADSTSWMPGQAWAIYDSASGGGQLRFSAPYAVGRSYTDAATIALETSSFGSKRIRFNADSYYLGSFGGFIDFRLEGSTTFNLIEPSGARLDFELGASGSGFGATLFDSRNANGSKREIVFRASQVTFDSGSTGTRAFTMGSNYTSPSSPIFLDANAGDVGNEGAGFSTRKVVGGRIDFVGSYGENYKWIKVWDVAYASDAAWKDEVVEIARADSLAQLRKLRPVEYGVKGFDPLSNRTRGLIAQEVKAAVPSAAVGEDGDMGVGSYALITTLVSAVQELADRVDALHPQPPTRSPA